MTKKYTREDLEDLIYTPLDRSWDTHGPDNDTAAANEVLNDLFNEGIFDPNQVEGA